MMGESHEVLSVGDVGVAISPKQLTELAMHSAEVVSAKERVRRVAARSMSRFMGKFPLGREDSASGYFAESGGRHRMVWGSMRSGKTIARGLLPVSHRTSRAGRPGGFAFCPPIHTLGITFRLINLRAMLRSLVRSNRRIFLLWLSAILCAVGAPNSFGDPASR